MMTPPLGTVVRRLPVPIVAVAMLAAACSDDDAAPDVTPVVGEGSTQPTTPGTSGAVEVAAGEAFPQQRCEANEAAGTITYLSGFDFAASASIVEVLVAHDKGYFQELCLDVEIKPSLSVRNYQPVAAGDAEFASGGSFSEVLSYASSNQADLVALAVEGRAPIDVLILKPGTAESLADLAGTTIGVKGKLNPSVAAMLAGAGLEEGVDFDTVLLDGYDPLAHIEIPAIAGFPGYRSNEPGQLERSGVDFQTFDPIDYQVPGSFGVIFSSADFVNEHPTAAQDFMRAAMKGLADAMADPDAATQIAVELINGSGNPNFLSPEGERFRWRVESELVGGTPDDPPGVIDPERLQAELDAYAEIGMFGDQTPQVEGAYSPLLDDVYADDGTVIWPSG